GSPRRGPGGGEAWHGGCTSVPQEGRHARHPEGHGRAVGVPARVLRGPASGLPLPRVHGPGRFRVRARRPAPHLPGALRLRRPGAGRVRSSLLAPARRARGLGRGGGTMRITPRSAGPLEAEEYFRLPRHLLSPRTAEVTRFAILPEHRRGEGVMPSVSFGLFKLLINFLDEIGARHAVVCSKEERIWT